MRKKFTMLFAALLACVGVMKADVNSELVNKKIAAIGDPATSVTSGQWYILNNVGRGNYVSEETTAMKMRATGSCVAGNYAEQKAGYLFKITASETAGQYHIQSGNGKFFSLGWNSSAISESAVEYQITLIGNSTNNFCLFDVVNGYAADGQETGNGFVGWSDKKPSSAGGNDSYRLLPVSLEEIPLTNFAVLNEAIASANSVLATAGYTFAMGDPVALQIENAEVAGYLSVSHPAIDGDVLANAIDKDGDKANYGTLYHSDWTAGKADPYMQVDLGDGQSLNAFVLNYSTRQSGNNGAPYAITVSGSNDGEEFTEITKLSKYDGINALPAVNAKNYTGVFVADKAYRYLRFAVTSSPNGNNSFGLSNFAINKLSVTGDMTGTKMRYATIYKAVLDATAMVSNEDLHQEEVDAAAAYLNGLVAIVTATCPFELTTDVENPVCYMIKSGRTAQSWNNPYWTLSDNKITITEFETQEAAVKNANTYWYFVEDKNTGLLTMYSYVDHAVMGYKAVADGADKLTNVPADYVGVKYQLVVNDGDYPYALKPYGYNTYVSNHGGRGKTMGFYNDVNDHGTHFALEKVEVTPSAEFLALSLAIEEANLYMSKGGSAIGLYSEASIATLGEAVEAAQTVCDDVNSTNEDYQTQTAALTAAISNLKINVPATGKFYRLKNVASGRYMCADKKYDNVVVIDNGSAIASTIFCFGEKNELLSYAEGQYVDCANKVLAAVGTSLNGEFGVAYGGPAANVITYKNNGYWTFGNRGHEVSIDRGSSTPDQEGYSWTIEEVTWLPVAMSVTAGYATIYSPVELALSYGRVKAYTATREDNVLTLVEQTVVPANTGVILELQEGKEGDVENGYVFLQIQNTTVEKVADNALVGSFAKSAKNAEAKVYTLQNGKSGVGFYLFKGYKDEADQEGTKTYINGFRAWIEVAAGEEAPAMFSFGRGQGTTSIENALINTENAVIYDLAGRRVEKMEKGIYIVNGRKVVVK